MYVYMYIHIYHIEHNLQKNDTSTANREGSSKKMVLLVEVWKNLLSLANLKKLTGESRSIQDFVSL